MASTRMDKNKKLHQELKEEERIQQTSKAKEYEEKVKSLDPFITKENAIVEPEDEDLDHLLDKYDEEDDNLEDDFLNEEETEEATVEVVEEQGKNVPTSTSLIKKPELKYEYTKEIFESNKEIAEQPLTFTDKIYVEELLRKRIEEQEKLREKSKRIRRTPTTKEYTAEDMQERIKILDGVDIRKELRKGKGIKRKTKNVLDKVVIVTLLTLIVAGIVVIAYLMLK